MGLLQLPPELQLAIAEYCHYQPRKRRNPWSGALPSDGPPEKISGGGLEWLSLVCKPLRNLVVPLMFTRLYIQCQPADLHSHLACLRDNHEILRVARYVTLAFAHDFEPGTYHQDAPDMVVDIIKVMPSLEELSFEIIGEAFISNRCQRAARDGSAARLERVKGLHWQHTGVDSAHMASLFPSLERLCVDLNWRAECESKEVAELIGPFADLPVLSLLVVGQLEPWPEQDIEDLVDTFPTLRRLTIKGQLEDVTIPGMTSVFAKMSSPEFLAITNDVETYEDWRPDHELTSSQEDVEKHEPAARSLFAACPSLRDIFLLPPGDYYSPLLGANGQLVHARKTAGRPDDDIWPEDEDFGPIRRFDVD